ncbi:MAG TPA: glycosyltransferase family 2 protein [Bacteroidota bacterium]|nr:glycosyltransferase family 2 protein [Bacteroidota bacterium]
MPRESSAARPLVSVIIVNFNGKEFLGPCLASIFAQSYRPFDVIVVDNGSTDGSLQLALREFPEVRVIANPGNKGFAEANNQGTRIAGSDLVVLLNNDTVVKDGWIEGLLDGLAAPGVAVVTSKVITEGVPSRFYAMNGTINFLGYNIMRHFTDTSMVFFGGGASLAFRKNVVGEPFLSEYFLYHEDVYLSWRMRLRGNDVRMAPTSIVYHLGSASTKRQPSAIVTFYQERNRLLNALLLYGPRTLAKLFPYFVSDGIAKTAAAILGRGKSLRGILRAYWWIFAHVGWVHRQRRVEQAWRAVDDTAILSLMSPNVLDGEGTVARFANRISLSYARGTGLLRHG